MAELWTKIGVTGHQRLTPETERKVSRSIAKILALETSVVGLTSLAEGADQLFAQQVLRHHGRLHAVIPSHGYESTFEAKDLERFRELLADAAETTSLAFPDPTEEAFLAAGTWIVDHSNRLIAVWNGQPSEGRGGTGDIVAYARKRGLQVTIVWPPGSARK